MTASNNGHRPELLEALKRAYILRKEASPRATIIADLEDTFGLDKGDAVAAVIMAEGFDAYPGAPKIGKADHDDDGFEAVLQQYSEIAAKRTTWTWEGRIPLGTLSLEVGTEGLGKSALGFALAAMLTHGTLPGDLLGTPINVAVFTPEDDPARTNRPRLEAAGADLDRVFSVRMRRDAHDRGLSLPRDTDKIARALIDSGVGFVFADPLASMLDPRLNSWKDTDVREAFEPIVAVLAEHGITMLGPLHTNKTNSTDPRQRAINSVGWQQIARAALLVGLDPEDPEGRVGPSRCVALYKHNYGPPQRTVRYTLDAVPVSIEGVSQDVVRAVLGEECDVRPAAMLAHEQEHADAGDTKEDHAIKWLRGFLEDGPKARKVIEDAAEAAGHTWRTVERAKCDLGVKAFRPEGAKGWSWRLPEEGISLTAEPAPPEANTAYVDEGLRARFKAADEADAERRLTARASV